MDAPPVWEIFTVRGALAVPIACAENTSCEGLTAIAGGCNPVPERGIDWFRMASETMSVPVKVPAEAGANTTLMAQLAFAPSEPPQLFEA